MVLYHFYMMVYVTFKVFFMGFSRASTQYGVSLFLHDGVCNVFKNNMNGCIQIYMLDPQGASKQHLLACQVLTYQHHTKYITNILLNIYIFFQKSLFIINFATNILKVTISNLNFVHILKSNKVVYLSTSTQGQYKAVPIPLPFH